MPLVGDLVFDAASRSSDDFCGRNGNCELSGQAQEGCSRGEKMAGSASHKRNHTDVGIALQPGSGDSCAMMSSNPAVSRLATAANSLPRALGLAALCALVAVVAPLPASAAAGADLGFAFAQPALSCACFDGAELHIDPKVSLADKACTCAFAARVRKDLATVVRGMPVRHDQDKMKLALEIEDKFITLSPEYERLFRYDISRYRWFLQNVRCVCSGCKATVYFSNCQLTCAPAIVYKRRARVFLALGFTAEELIDFYHAEYNATHSHREQIRREWLLPRREKKRGWMVPAALILGAVVILATFLRRIVRLSSIPSPAGPVPAGGAGVAIADALSKEERDRLLDELDDIED